MCVFMHLYACMCVRLCCHIICMCVCVCVCAPNDSSERQAYIHAYMHTYIHAYMRTYIHAYMYTYIHAYMHREILAGSSHDLSRMSPIHTLCLHTCIHEHVQPFGTSIEVSTYIHTYIHTCSSSARHRKCREWAFTGGTHLSGYVYMYSWVCTHVCLKKFHSLN